MLARSFLWITQHSAGGRRLLFRWFFELLARQARHADEWRFMNYGYAEDSDQLPLDPDDENERYCIQLYHHVASCPDLADKDVLEISSGRGGGASYLCRYLGPRSVTAVDIAPSAVAFCRRVYRLAGLRFIQGDAEDLPIFDSSVDIVLNIEASFCYGDIARFLAEVRRVLRPGGYFLYADLRLAEEMDGLRAALRCSGLQLERSADITKNVVRALQLDAARRDAGAARIGPWFLRGAMRLFVGADGTRIPTCLRDGRMQYHCFALRKPMDEADRREVAPVPVWGSATSAVTAPRVG